MAVCAGLCGGRPDPWRLCVCQEVACCSSTGLSALLLPTQALRPMSQVADVYRKVRFTLRYLLGNLSDFDPQGEPLCSTRLGKPSGAWSWSPARAPLQLTCACILARRPAASCLHRHTPPAAAHAVPHAQLAAADRYILSRFAGLVEECSAAYESYQFYK